MSNVEGLQGERSCIKEKKEVMFHCFVIPFPLFFCWDLDQSWNSSGDQNKAQGAQGRGREEQSAKKGCDYILTALEKGCAAAQDALQHFWVQEEKCRHQQVFPEFCAGISIWMCVLAWTFFLLFFLGTRWCSTCWAGLTWWHSPAVTLGRSRGFVLLPELHICFKASSNSCSLCTCSR